MTSQKPLSVGLTGLKTNYKTLRSGIIALYVTYRPTGEILGTYHGKTRAECDKAMENDALNIAQIWVEIHKPTPTRQTLQGLFTLWLQSNEFKRLSERTQYEWRKIVDIIRNDKGNWTIRDLEDPRCTSKIIDYRDTFEETPRKADYIVQVMRAGFKWCKLRGYITRNPCTDIPTIYRSDRSEIVWENHEIEALCANTHEYAARAFLFLILTGFRRGDAIEITWNDVKDGYIRRKTSKSNRTKTQSVKISPELQKLLDSCPKTATTILTSSKGIPWTGGGLRQAFDKAKAKAGITADKRIHDMRGTSATDKIIDKILQSNEYKEAFGWTGNNTSAPRKYVAIENVIKTRFGE